MVYCPHVRVRVRVYDRQVNLEPTPASTRCDFAFHGQPSGQLLPLLFDVEEETLAACTAASAL